MNAFKPRPKRDADDFVERAPDAGAEVRDKSRGGPGTRITLIVRPEVLARIDAAARKRGISRSAFMIAAASEQA